MPASVNINDFLKGLEKADAQIRAAAARGLKKAAYHVMGQAQILAPEGGGLYSPYDPEPGRLRDSAKVEGPEIAPNSITCTVGFNTVYAAVQHERLDFRHSNGQAKYLETALRANEQKIVEIVAAEVKGGT